ncbi:hypothetical protein [Sphingomonas sp. Y38-1Y]|uniref:hypothetical protein n=1 Tax=Sphingomonas sp. Y38-1Y TaxID=3078265 RepID=UPI0028EF2631|nr:hypothetical protein [Sphingomonas sp. Y38-1Y]
MKMRFLAALGAASFFCAPAMAQEGTPTAVDASAPMVTGQTENIVRTGTPVPLRVLEMLTTKGKNLKVGHRFNMEVSEAVIVNGHIVIPAGAPAVGEVTEVRNKGMWGKSGYIKARAVSLTANGRQIRLSGDLDDKGVAAGGGAVAVSAVVFLPAGFFMTGTSAVIPVGAITKGFVNEDIAFTPAAQAATMALAPAAVVPVDSAPTKAN